MPGRLTHPLQGRKTILSTTHDLPALLQIPLAGVSHLFTMDTHIHPQHAFTLREHLIQSHEFTDKKPGMGANREKQGQG